MRKQSFEVFQLATLNPTQKIMYFPSIVHNLFLKFTSQRVLGYINLGLFLREKYVL